MSQIKCLKCDAENRKEAKFCGRCGQPLHVPQQPSIAPSQGPLQRVRNRSRREVIIGEVQGFQEEFCDSGWLWTFRVERGDQSGSRLPAVSVIMFGYSFDGQVSDGDRVEIPGQWRMDRIVEPQQLRNLSSGIEVKAKDVIIGRVADFRERTENRQGRDPKTIWSFRVERFDRSGNKLPPVPVEMSSTKNLSENS